VRKTGLAAADRRADRRSFVRSFVLIDRRRKEEKKLKVPSLIVPITASGPQGEQPLVHRIMWVREVGKVDLKLREKGWLFGFGRLDDKIASVLATPRAFGGEAARLFPRRPRGRGEKAAKQKTKAGPPRAFSKAPKKWTSKELYSVKGNPTV